jgi:hypothetical protein
MIVKQRKCDTCGCSMTEDDRRFRLQAQLEFVPSGNGSAVVPAASPREKPERSHGPPAAIATGCRI